MHYSHLWFVVLVISCTIINGHNNAIFLFLVTIIDHWELRFSFTQFKSQPDSHSFLSSTSVCLLKIVSSITLTSESSSQQQHTMSHNKVLNQLFQLLHLTQGQAIFTPITDIWHFSFQNIGPLPTAHWSPHPQPDSAQQVGRHVVQGAGNKPSDNFPRFSLVRRKVSAPWLVGRGCRVTFYVRKFTLTS